MLCPKSLSAGEHHNISLAYPVSDPTNFFGIPTVNYSTPSKDQCHCRGNLEAFSVCPASLHPKNLAPQNPCDSDEIIRKTLPLAVLITKAGTWHGATSQSSFSETDLDPERAARVIPLQDTEQRHVSLPSSCPSLTGREWHFHSTQHQPTQNYLFLPFSAITSISFQETLCYYAEIAWNLRQRWWV